MKLLEKCRCDAGTALLAAGALLLLAGVGLWIETGTDPAYHGWRLALPTASGALLVASGLVSRLRPAYRELEPVGAWLQAVIRGDGSLQAAVPVAGRGAAARLSADLEALRRQVVDRLGAAADAGSRLAGAASELSSDAEELNDEVTRQHAELDQVATAVNEMTATVQEVARNTAEAASAANTARDEAENGALQATHAITSIEKLDQEIGNATGEIDAVHAESQNIHAVLDVIRGIAEQTNLLALNAAIEAARAGEQGRGFAVVAEEVRSLATRTSESLAEIETMIGRLGTQTASAVQAMQTAAAQAKESVDMVEKAAMSLGEIAGSVKRINDMNAQVAAATEEQSAVAEEINQNVVSLARIAESAAENARHLSESSEKVLREMAGLNKSLRV